MWKAKFAITRTDAKGRERRICKQLSFERYDDLVRYREMLLDDPRIVELFEKVTTPWTCCKRGESWDI